MTLRRLSPLSDEIHWRFYDQFPEKFNVDCIDELKLTDNPKANLLMSKAYELGHSAGFNEIYIIAQDLMELIV